MMRTHTGKKPTVPFLHLAIQTVSLTVSCPDIYSFVRKFVGLGVSLDDRNVSLPINAQLRVFHRDQRHRPSPIHHWKLFPTDNRRLQSRPNQIWCPRSGRPIFFFDNWWFFHGKSFRSPNPTSEFPGKKSLGHENVQYITFLSMLIDFPCKP